MLKLDDPFSFVVPLIVAADAPSWFPLVGIALGGVIFVACWQMIDLVWHRYRGARTTGRVIKLEEQEMDDSDGSTVFASIIEYRMDGRRCRIKSLIAMAPALYRVGQEVPV